MRGTQFSQLTAFVAVAENRSFTKAAAHLGFKTPTLSHAVRSLEEQFGVRLLNRTTRSVGLTDAGEQLLRRLTPVLQSFERAIDGIIEFRDTPTGILRLSVHPLAAATVIAPMVARFSVQYPEISLDISVAAEGKDIVGDGFDASVHPGDGIALDMIAVPLGGHIRFVTVAAPGYLARTSVPSVPGDLQQHNCIRYRGGPGSDRHPWRFGNRDQIVEVAVKGSLTVNDPTLALRAALDGLGIVQMPETWTAPLVADGRLVALLHDWPPCRAEFSLFYSGCRHLPVKLRVLVDFLRQEARSGAHAGDGRPPRLSVVAGAGRRRSERPSDQKQGHAGDAVPTGEVIPIGVRRLGALTPATVRAAPKLRKLQSTGDAT